MSSASPTPLDYVKASLRRGSAFFNRQNLPLIATIVVTALLYLVGALAFDRFATPRVLLNFIADNAFLGIAAVGITFVILSGGIDLSVGAAIACASVIISTLVARGVHPAIAIAVVLVIGTAFGTAQGMLIRLFNLPAFLVTLAGLFFCRGSALLISPQARPIDHPFYTAMSDFAVPLGERLRLPLPSIVFLVVLVIGIYLARSTRFGRNCYALGGNEQSAALMGLPVGTTKVGVYALSGLCSALAGVMLTVYSPSGNPIAAVGLELDAIAAVVVGGTLLSGGSGSVLGTLFGVLIFGIINTLITFKGDIGSEWTRITVGVLLLLFVLLQKLIQRKGT